MLTKKRKEVLDFIRKYKAKKKYAPSLEEIRKHFRLASVSTAHFHVKKLQEAGYLQKEYNQPRGIDVFEKEQMITIPLFGTIAAGAPIEVIENKETIAVPKSKLPRSEDFYALRVTGDSMIDENISDGDIVIVKNQPTADNGQRVVALIDNYEVTLKKIYKEKNKIRLQPANPRMEPIFVDPSMLIIQGVVIDIIKSEQESIQTPYYTISKEKRPKGGCELTYRDKTKKEEVIFNTKPANLKLIKKYGTNRVNKLVLGDNLGVLKALYGAPQIKNKVNLIYIDPPFGTGQDFIGYNKENGYSDRLVNTEFLEFLKRRLIFLRELLAESGSIYLHIDQKIGHYVKILMDEIFGEENFRNDITRIKCNPKNFERKAYGNIKDVIYFYSKSKPNKHDPIYWSDYRIPLTEEGVVKQFPKIDKFGRRYATVPIHAAGETKNGPTGRAWKGLMPPKGKHWQYNPKYLTKLDNEGRIEWSATGNPRKIIYAAENPGKKIQDIWEFKDPGFQRALYPTEKNEDMLSQIIKMSSKEGDLVLDCFCGSGTTLVAAEKLKRSWMGIDNNLPAIKTTEKKLASLNKEGLFSKPVSYSFYKVI